MLLFGIEILLVKIVLDVLDRTTEKEETQETQLHLLSQVWDNMAKRTAWLPRVSARQRKEKRSKLRLGELIAY